MTSGVSCDGACTTTSSLNLDDNHTTTTNNNSQPEDNELFNSTTDRTRGSRLFPDYFPFLVVHPLRPVWCGQVLGFGAWCLLC